MTIDKEQIKKNYENFNDSRIEYLAKNEAASLEPEVVPILIDEIKKRNLDINLIKGIEAQTKKISEEELHEVNLKIKNLSCPECGQNKSPLIGTLLRIVKSFVYTTSYQKITIISCKTCANEKIKDAFITTILFGWWGIPMGLIQTPQAIIATLNDKKNRELQSDEILTLFAIENIGEIKTNWDNEQELTEFIHHTNRQD